MQNALMKIYIDTRTTAPRNTSPPIPQDRVASATTARSANHSSSSSPTSAACATTSSPMMMPLSKLPLIATRRPLTTADSVEESAHRHLAHLLLHQEQAVCLAQGVYLGAQHVGRIQDVCTRGRQIPLQSISKLRAARNVCLVHLGQHQAAVGAACKATSTRTCKRKGTHPAKGVPAGADLRASSSTPTSTASSTRTGRRRRHLQLRLVDCRHAITPALASSPCRPCRRPPPRRAHRRRRHHTTATTTILATAATTIALALATVTAGEAAEPSPFRQIHRRCRRSACHRHHHPCRRRPPLFGFASETAAAYILRCQNDPVSL